MNLYEPYTYGNLIIYNFRNSTIFYSMKLEYTVFNFPLNFIYFQYLLSPPNILDIHDACSEPLVQFRPSKG